MNPQGATLAEVQAAFAGLPRMTAEQAQLLRDDIACLRDDDAAFVQLKVDIRTLAESWVRSARCSDSNSAKYGEQYAESLLELIGERIDD